MLRREESAFAARAIHDRVVQRLERENVFLDVDNTDLGVDWFNVLSERVGACDALVAVIGRNWVYSADKDNRRRIDDEDDFVRIEIEAALKRDVRVIPVLVDGAAMPKASELPDSLKGLARRQGTEISPARFDADVEKLTRALISILEARRSRDAAEAARRADEECGAQEAAEAERAAREEIERREAAEAARAEEARRQAAAETARQAEEERRAREAAEAERAAREDIERREAAEAARAEEARRQAAAETARQAEEERCAGEAAEAERSAREEHERREAADATRAEEARRLAEAGAARQAEEERRAKEADEAERIAREERERRESAEAARIEGQLREQYQTGNAYFYGIGGVKKPNEHEGIQWYLKAANQATRRRNSGWGRYTKTDLASRQTTGRRRSGTKRPPTSGTRMRNTLWAGYTKMATALRWIATKRKSGTGKPPIDGTKIIWKL